jgi:hypothetical protein
MTTKNYLEQLPDEKQHKDQQEDQVNHKPQLEDQEYRIYFIPLDMTKQP